VAPSHERAHEAAQSAVVAAHLLVRHRWRQRQVLGDPLVVDLGLAEEREEVREAVPCVRVVEGGLCDSLHLVYAVGENVADERVLRAETSVQGSHSDLGPRRDLGRGHIHALLGDEVAGRRDEPQAVAARVRALIGRDGRRLDGRHGPSLGETGRDHSA
jgi:hypothetical protein